jgi:hypothetical protein
VRPKIVDGPNDVDAAPPRKEDQKEEQPETMEGRQYAWSAVKKIRPVHMDVIDVAQIREQPATRKNAFTYVSPARSQGGVQAVDIGNAGAWKR